MKSAIGIGLIGFGILTAWAGIDKVVVFDILRSIVGGAPPARNPVGGTNLDWGAATAAFQAGQAAQGGNVVYPPTQGGSGIGPPPGVSFGSPRTNVR